VPSAEQLTEFIKSQFGGQQIGEQIEVVFQTRDERTQAVFFYTTKDFIVFESPFALATEVTAEQVLKAAQDYPVGVNLSGSVFVVRHLIPLADCSESEIFTAFEVVSRAGDDLEQNFSPGDRF
jgi:hypothetical protein